MKWLLSEWLELGMPLLVGLRLVSKEKDEHLAGAHMTVHSAVATALGLTVEHEEMGDNLTQVVLAPKISMIYFSNLVYRLNHAVTDSTGEPLFDSSRIAAHSDTAEFSWLANRQVVEQACRELAHLGFGYFLHAGDEWSHQLIWESLFTEVRSGTAYDSRNSTGEVPLSLLSTLCRSGRHRNKALIENVLALLPRMRFDDILSCPRTVFGEPAKVNRGYCRHHLWRKRPVVGLAVNSCTSHVQVEVVGKEVGIRE